MLSAFVNSKFFNDPNDKVYLVQVNVTDDNGFLKKELGAKKLLPKKVIIPTANEKVQGKTLVKTANLYLQRRLNFYDAENCSDRVIWQDNYYRVTEVMDRSKRNGYGYRYSLEYLNEDEI